MCVNKEDIDVLRDVQRALVTSEATSVTLDNQFAGVIKKLQAAAEKWYPRVENMTSSSSGREVPNQFLIYTDRGVFFQSYSTLIAAKLYDEGVLLDKDWDYSRTTGKYRNQFLRESKKETEGKIKEGVYRVVDLNK